MKVLRARLLERQLQEQREARQTSAANTVRPPGAIESARMCSIPITWSKTIAPRPRPVTRRPCSTEISICLSKPFCAGWAKVARQAEESVRQHCCSAPRGGRAFLHRRIDYNGERMSFLGRRCSMVWDRGPRRILAIATTIMSELTAGAICIAVS